MKFLVVTDLHYSDKPTIKDNRYHSLSAKKLKKAFAEYSSDCEFTACLGDIVDAFDGYKSQKILLTELNSVIEKQKMPFYATFGNHDTAMDKNEFIALTKMPARYYSFENEEYLCLMLDTCMNSKDEPYPQKEIAWADCYIDGEQLCWLKDKIENSKKRAVVFTHILLSSADTDEVDHILNNANEVTDILLANEEKIAAVFCGHYHFGMQKRIGNIPYFVFKSMCLGEKVTCATVEITDKKVKITGYGDEESVCYE